jgi:hypothetical protein
MAAYSSTQSGNFNNPATWGGSGWPDTNTDTFTVNAGHTVTYNITTPLNEGLGSSVVNSGGTFIMDNNTVIRFNGAATYHFACSGNFIKRPGARTLLKGTTASDRIYDIRPLSFVPTTATGTSGQNTITVASNVAQIIVGNKVSGTGIAAGSYVTNIAGNVLTLSKNNTGTVSGDLTVGNYVEIIGSEGMPITTVASAVTTSNHQQGFVVAADATDFVVGDWIAVYTRGTTDALVDRNDEGFIIHDKDSNTIYIREFVGPTTTISSASSNTITVANAKIFRTWQRLIFGTGANRNILGITGINYDTNVITLSANVTGTVTGLPVYTTGPLQLKVVGDKIRKVATTVSVQAVSTATTITLSSVAGFNVGDEVIIDALWNVAATSYTDELPNKRNITAINGNVITINQSMGHISFVGAFVTRVTRDIKFISDYETTLVLTAAQSFAVGDVITQAFSGASAVVKTATTSSTSVIVHDIFGQFVTGTANSPFISRNGTLLAGNVSLTTVTLSTTQGHSGFGFARNATFTANQLPVLYFRDVQVGTFSAINTTSSRLWVRGFWSSHENTFGGVEFEGITYCKPNQTDNFNYQDNAIFINRYLHDFEVRCCVVWNSVNGIFFNEGYDLRNAAAFNNIVSRSENIGLLIQHIDNASAGFNSAGGGASEFAFNYLHRIDDSSLRVELVRAPGRGVHHNWINVSQFRALDISFTYTQAILYQNRFQAYFEPTGSFGSNEHNLIYNEWIPANSLFDFSRDAGFQNHNMSVTFTTSVVSLEHNYEIDAVTIYIPNGMRVWDNAEQAWRTSFDDDAGAIDTGLAEVFYIPPNVTVKAKGTIKLTPDFGTTAPKLEIRGSMDRMYAGTNGSFSGDQPFRGYITSANFDAANKSTYQTVELTFDTKPWGRTVTVGVINRASASNSFRGWWEKPIEVEYSILPEQQFLDTGINKFSGKIYTTDNEAIKKVRIAGGRLI